jgi:transcription termination factor NusB
VWDKDLRILIFQAIYQNIYWSSQMIDFSINYPLPDHPDITINNSQPKNKYLLFDESNYDKTNNSKISKSISKFVDHQEEFENRLKAKTKNWSHTPLVQKACLYCFLLEYEELLQESIASNNSIKQMIRKYLDISEEYSNKQSTTLIHAIMIKLTNYLEN